MEFDFIIHNEDEGTAALMGIYTDCQYLCGVSCTANQPMSSDANVVRMNNLYWNIA